MQIVRNQHHPASGLVADPPDQIVKRHLAGKIDPLHGFVEHQEVGPPDHRAGDQRALKFPARKRMHLRPGQMGNPHHLKRCRDLGFGPPPRQPHQPFHSHGQRAVHGDFLRHIADGKVFRAPHAALIGLDDAQSGLDRCRFARSIRPDQRHDFPARDGHIHPAHQPAPVALHPDAFNPDDIVALGCAETFHARSCQMCIDSNRNVIALHRLCNTIT